LAFENENGKERGRENVKRKVYDSRKSCHRNTYWILLDTESVSNDRVTLWELYRYGYLKITKPISISPRGGIAAPEFE
jgi:hypothetical protein